MRDSFFYRSIKMLLMAGMVLILAAGQAKAEPVKVRAAAHDGYGRIVFNWSTAVPFKVNTTGSQLVVSFGSPIEPSLGGVVRNLSKYLSGAAAGADGHSVVFTMKEDFDARSFDMGAAIIIDITDAVQAKKAPKAKKIAAAKVAAQTSSSGPTVKVRSGVHDDYTRIVFDWPNKVPYQLQQTAGQAIIKFSSPARLEIGALQRRLPKLISSINAESTDSGPSVTMAIPQTSRIRHFLSGPKVVVDVMKPTGESLPQQVAKAAPEVPQKTARNPVVKPDLKPAKKAAAEAIAPAPAAVPSKPVEKAAAPAAPPKTAQSGKPTALTPPSRGKKSQAAKDLQGSLSEISGVKIVGGGAGGKAVKPIAVDSGADAIGIRFDWDEPVAAAVFRRYSYLWVIFDKNTKMNLVALKEAAGNIFRSIEQVPNDGATLLRIVTVSGVNPTLKRDGLAWILEFRQQPIVPTTAIEVTPQPDSLVGARLFLPVTEPGKVISLTDPAIGDSLIVVPLIPLGYGVAKQHDYPQARILPSSQGLVVQPRADDLQVRSLRQGVVMTSSSGLKISAVAAAQAVETKLDDSMLIRSLSRLFDLEKWRQANLDTFEENKWKYQMAAANAKSTGREAARMDMARFYFANGFGQEALGVLNVVEEERPQIGDSPEFHGLRGAINVLMGRYEDARAELEHESLNDNDEARFWRATLQAYEGDLFGAAANLRRMAGITRPYPQALKIPLGVLIAEAAVELGDIKQANRHLKTMIAAAPNPAEMSQIQYVEGRVLELSGDFDGAVGKWEEVQEGPHRPSRAKAALARTELLLEQGLIDDFDAILELEKLRFAWRGDELEFVLLRRLGGLYIAVGDYRNGLRTMRQAATHFRDYKEAAEVTQQMIDSFTNLYLEGKADNLAPITAIALYDEFKELTPPGEKGAEMIRRLADRLVDVDLLDRAAVLLQDQVEFRLNGAEKARVGAQLALIHVLAHEFEDSIRVLDETAVEGLPDELVEQRRHLRSRSLMGQERTEEALALLKEDKSIDADLLRMEMYWNDHDWVQVSLTLNRLLRVYEAKPKQPLDELQAQTVLNMGVAMTLSGNARGIDRLRRDYGAAMDESRFRDAFRLIASPDTMGLISYPSIAGKVADAENFQTFMSAYQEHLKERKLSEIN
jgi:tetratricopeptide (TPR) repeat protein